MNASLRVTVISLDCMLFQGTAGRVVLPGELGTFEVLPLHRPLVSRLLAGEIVIDDKSFSVKRGVARVADDVVTVVVESA